VVGDGVSSIRRLIRQENKKRVKSGSQLAQALIYLDLDTKYTLAAQGMNLRTTPAKGQTVKVKDVINSNRGEDNESPPEGLGESLIALCRKISETIGVSLVGIDIITEDLTIDLRKSGGAVIEVNTPPGHFYHHLKKGRGYSVAKRLLQHAFEDRKADQQQSKTLSSPIATPSWSAEPHRRGGSL
jgi:D-alanine-D-alanine ligase-like ATP-grasp enzyme